jgi:methylated-DNA-protein-cysteine methyltransferase-like protein
MASATDSASGWRPVYRVVCRIPAGQVATYGQIAALSGMPRAARQVGWALSALREEDDVPWHRVINAQGEISPRGGPEIVDMQRALLESEGIEFSARGRVDLDCYAWVPGRRKAVSRTPGQKRASKKARKTTQKTAGQKVSKKARKKARKKAPKPAGKAAPKQRGSNR